jgi:hypothetical protein
LSGIILREDRYQEDKYRYCTLYVQLQIYIIGSQEVPKIFFPVRAIREQFMEEKIQGLNLG